MNMEPESKEREDGRLWLRILQEDGVEELHVGDSPCGEKKGGEEMTEKAGKKNVKERMLGLREQVLQCTLCSELASTRKNVVFGSGHVKAGLMFVGEAPGRDEDLQGLPFVGRAGQLLTKIIESIGLSREQVFIGNVLKCRPPGNRPPEPDEILNCQPFLMKQIELIQPRIICALGTFAAQTLLKTGDPISRLRGRFYDYPGLALPEGRTVKVLCTFHPAYLLRNPAEKRKVWEDMKMIKKELENLSRG